MVSRNADIRPAAAVVIRRLKTGDNLSGVERVMEFPEAVQGMAQACFADAQFLKVCVSDVIGMRVNPVFGEKRRDLSACLRQISSSWFPFVVSEKASPSRGREAQRVQIYTSRYPMPSVSFADRPSAFCLSASHTVGGKLCALKRGLLV